jgi:predicted nuclease of predicted toxin-antitoxin system
VKFKLDENLSPALASMFAAAGHDAHSVIEQALGGQPDDHVLDVCNRENRALISFDLDFANIIAYPPANFHGIVVLRLSSQAHLHAEAAVQRILAQLPAEEIPGRLWIVEEHRIRIQG